MCGGWYVNATLDRNQKRKQSISLDGLKWFNGWGSIETDAPAHRGMCNRVVQRINLQQPWLDAIWARSEGCRWGFHIFEKKNGPRVPCLKGPQWFIMLILTADKVEQLIGERFSFRGTRTVSGALCSYGHTRKNDNYVCRRGIAASRP